MNYQWNMNGLPMGHSWGIILWQTSENMGKPQGMEDCAAQIIQKYGEIGGDCMGNSFKNGESLEKHVEKKSCQKIVLFTRNTSTLW